MAFYFDNDEDETVDPFSSGSSFSLAQPAAAPAQGPATLTVPMIQITPSSPETTTLLTPKPMPFFAQPTRQPEPAEPPAEHRPTPPASKTPPAESPAAQPAPDTADAPAPSDAPAEQPEPAPASEQPPAEKAEERPAQERPAKEPAKETPAEAAKEPTLETVDVMSNEAAVRMFETAFASTFIPHLQETEKGVAELVAVQMEVEQHLQALNERRRRAD